MYESVNITNLRIDACVREPACVLYVYRAAVPEARRRGLKTEVWGLKSDPLSQFATAS